MSFLRLFTKNAQFQRHFLSYSFFIEWKSFLEDIIKFGELKIVKVIEKSDWMSWQGVPPLAGQEIQEDVLDPNQRSIKV